MEQTVVQLKDVTMKDLANVGGKNASLGEMIGGLKSIGVQVPDGFFLSPMAKTLG